MSTTARPTHPRLGTWGATLLVAEREILSQVRSKAFLISTVITLVLVHRRASSSRACWATARPRRRPSRSSDPCPPRSPTPAPSTSPRSPTAPTAEDAGARRDRRRGARPRRLRRSASRVVALDEAPEGLVSALSVSPEVELLDPPRRRRACAPCIGPRVRPGLHARRASARARRSCRTPSRRSSRASSRSCSPPVPARALLAGKILGNSVIGVGTAAAIAAASALGLAITGQTELLDLLSAPADLVRRLLRLRVRPGGERLRRGRGAGVAAGGHGLGDDARDDARRWSRTSASCSSATTRSS